MPEYERVAGIRLESLQPGADRLIGGDVLRPIQTAHCRVEEPLDIGQPIRDRGIDGSGLIEASLREIGLLRGENRIAEDFRLLGVAIRAKDDFDDLLEVEQPERQVETAAGAEDQTLLAECTG